MNLEYAEITHRLDNIEQALSLFNKQRRYIDLDELSEILGIAKRTYYQNQADYDFKKFKFGKKLRFDRQEVVSWMNSKINSTAAEVVNQIP